MAFAGKVLADGQLAITKGTLYTVPATTVAYVKFLSVFNTNAITQTVIIYVNTGGTSRKIANVSFLAVDEYSRIIDKDEALVLEAGDLIEGETTTASAVDFTIQGVEEDVT